MKFKFLSVACILADKSSNIKMYYEVASNAYNIYYKL